MRRKKTASQPHLLRHFFELHSKTCRDNELLKWHSQNRIILCDQTNLGANFQPGKQTLVSDFFRTLLLGHTTTVDICRIPLNLCEL